MTSFEEVGAVLRFAAGRISDTNNNQYAPAQAHCETARNYLKQAADTQDQAIKEAEALQEVLARAHEMAERLGDLSILAAAQLAEADTAAKAAAGMISAAADDTAASTSAIVQALDTSVQFANHELMSMATDLYQRSGGTAAVRAASQTGLAVDEAGKVPAAAPLKDALDAAAEQTSLLLDANVVAHDITKAAAEPATAAYEEAFELTAASVATADKAIEVANQLG